MDERNSKAVQNLINGIVFKRERVHKDKYNKKGVNKKIEYLRYQEISLKLNNRTHPLFKGGRGFRP